MANQALIRVKRAQSCKAQSPLGSQPRSRSSWAVACSADNDLTEISAVIDETPSSRQPLRFICYTQTHFIHCGVHRLVVVHRTKEHQPGSEIRCRGAANGRLYRLCGRWLCQRFAPWPSTQGLRCRNQCDARGSSRAVSGLAADWSPIQACARPQRSRGH